ncbi:MAG: hypothetical protein V3V14_01315 [Saprospiraceae bacterium]
MGPTLVYSLIGLFVVLLFFQLYFRLKVIKVYRRLVQNEVEFSTTHIFNKKKMEEEVISKYPLHKDDILTFVSQMKFSLQIAAIMIFIIFVVGLIMRRL